MSHFFKWWIGVFVVTLTALSLSGLVPQKMRELQNSALSLLMNHSALASNEVVEVVPKKELEIIEKPTHLTIPAAHIDFAIVESNSTDVAKLDALLTKGIVHYPGSALLGAEGNVLLFGHSSHLKYVRNPAFKSLTGIEKLKADDRIIVRGEAHEFVYAVVSLRLANKNDELVEFDREGTNELTISTCNTFGKKDDRYVVTAKLLYTSEISTVLPTPTLAP